MKKIVFFGSDDFALCHLEGLSSIDCEIVCCVTQPDRAKGRGMKTGFSVIKEYALENNIEVLQPEDIKDKEFEEALKKYQADLFVVIAYGQILPKSLLNIPKICAINVHGSLLPKYRGAAPINWAILNGDTQTGLTIIHMNPKMDGGGIINQVSVPISKDDTAQDLRSKMMEEGSILLNETVMKIEDYLKTEIAQDESQVTKAPKLTKELGLIDFNRSAEHIKNQVRALQPWPGAYTHFRGKTLKILDCLVLENCLGKPGEITEVNKSGITVSTQKGCLLIKQVHYQDAKAMSAHDFSIGHHIRVQEAFA